MSYAQLGIIEANDYNVFVQGGVSSVNHNVANLNTIWGTGTGNKGYGQSGSLSTVSATSTVLASEWATLINRAKAIMNHQGNSVLSSTNAPTYGSIISYLDTLATAITDGYNNRLTAGSNGTDVAQSPVPSSITWNLPAPTTVQMVYTATWANADQARYFFNAGGQLRLALYATNDGSTTKGSDWADLITNKVGTFVLSSASCSRTGTGGTATINSLGYWDLTTSDQTLLSVSSATAAYTSSNITVKVRTNGTQGANSDNGTVVTFTIDLSDDGLNLTDSYDDNINISIYNQLNIRPPESTYLTTSIANPSVTRDSYNVDTSGVNTVGGGARSFEYYAAGTYTWTVPTGVTSIRAMLVGGGGSGGSSETGGGSCSGDGGGGGGGGELVTAEIPVTPGHSLQLTVGAGGAGPGGSNSPGAAGGTSSIINLNGTDDSLYSASFNGSTHLKVNSTSPLNFGSSDFTIEAWVYLNAMPTVDDWNADYSSTMVVICVGTPVSSDGFGFIIGQNYLMVQNNDTRYISTVTHKMRINNWYHLSCVRSGNSLLFWVSGQSVGAVTFTSAVGTGSGTYIGCETANGAFINGKISNLRVVSGTALYTSSFSPSRRVLTAISGTTLLTCKSAALSDSGPYSYSITNYGGVTVSNDGTRTTLLTATGGFGGGAGGNGHDPSRGLGGPSGFGGYGDSSVTQYRFTSTGGGHSNAQNCAGGCCAGFDGGDLTWASGSIFQTRANGGFGIRGLGGLYGWASGGGGGGGASLGDGGRGGNGNGAATDSRSMGMPGAYGGGGGGSCDEVTTANTRGAGGTGYVFIEYGTGTTPAATTAQVYVIGGGGGGGGGDNGAGGGGGGGGGGVVSQTLAISPGNSFAVVIGSGGAGGYSNSGTTGTKGGDSSFGAIIAWGGGGGGNASGAAQTCPTASIVASTGGTGRVWPACSTTSGQGYAGGIGGGSTPGSVTDAGGGGGGGGAGSAGANGTALSAPYPAAAGGNGGAGTNLTISGSTLMYGAGGGGGAGTYGSGVSGTSGSGGTGGAPNNLGTAGTANQGGGGGGSGVGLSGVQTGGGGSGAVIITYSGVAAIATGGTITISGGTVTHRFTASGNFIVS